MPFVSHAERARRRKARLCMRCISATPNDAAPGKRTCEECLHDQKYSMRHQRADERERGRCACGAYRRLGRMNCASCAALACVKARMKELLLIDMGVCIRCMKSPARPRQNKLYYSKSTGKKNHQRATFTDCHECAQKRVDMMHKRALSRVRDALVANAKRAERAMLERG